MSDAASVLIVEDSQLQATMLRRMLGRHGFAARWARNGQEALEMMAQELPAVVLSDIDMPIMDGYALCRSIKSEPRLQQVPVVLLTNLNHPEDIVHGLNAGADNYLTKPVDEEYLLDRLRNLLRAGAPRAQAGEDDVLEVTIGGRRHRVTSGREQILGLLLSTFETAVQQNAELIKVNRQLAEAQAHLTEQNARLLQLNLQKNLLLGMAAHDLRNPLSAILGYSQFLLLKSDGLTPQAQKFLNSIQDSASFMLGMVEDLLDVTTLEAGQLTLKLERVDLRALAENVVQINRPLAEDKQIRVDIACPAQPVAVQADPSKLDQVVTNLLTNAIKFSYPDSRVAVRVELEPDYARLSVQDQGPGIPEDEQSRLFEPFGRTSVRSTAGEKSTGLGLAIARRIVEGHEGTLGCASQVGQGSTFWVRLPLFEG